MTAKTCSIREAAQVLGIGMNTAYQLARDGSIPSLRLGKQFRIPLAALNGLLRNPQLLAASKTKPKEAAHAAR